MVGTKTIKTEDLCRYKTAAAEERAIIRRLRTYRVKLEKEMEGMTNRQKADYMNKLGREAEARMRMEIECSETELQ